jgi:hypothetical protein
LLWNKLEQVTSTNVAELFIREHFSTTSTYSINKTELTAAAASVKSQGPYLALHRLIRLVFSAQLAKEQKEQQVAKWNFSTMCRKC